MEKQAGKRNYNGYRPKANNVLKLQSYFSQSKVQGKRIIPTNKIIKTKKS